MEKYVEDFYAEKFNLNDLAKLVEAELSGAGLLTEAKESTGGRFSMHVDLPSWTPSEAWGDPNSQDREQIMKIFSVVRGGRDIKAKLLDLNKFLDPKAAARKRSPGVIINMMLVIEALQATLNDFNESAAGFVFEGFMAALTGGKQIAGKVGGTLPIEDFVAFSDYGGGVPVSLKLLTLQGVTKGSYTNLVDYLIVRGEPMIKYLIAFKYTPSENVDQLQLWEFEINRSNFLTFIEGVGGGEGLLGRMRTTELENSFAAMAADGSKENRMRAGAAIMQTPGYGRGMIPAFLKAGGYNPKEAEQFRTPEEIAAAEKKALKKRTELDRKKAGGERDMAAFMDRENEMAESFHAREKRLMKEELLVEGKDAGTQWKATWKQIKDLHAEIGLHTFGSLELSQDRIDQLAEIYTEKLKGDVMTLLTETKNLADNIGSYYREKRRAKAQASAVTALESSEKITDVLEKDPRYSDQS